MKKLLLLFSLIMSCAFVIAQNGQINLKSVSKSEIKQSDFSVLRATFSYESLVSTVANTEHGAFSRIALPATYPSGEIGAPELPATHHLLAVPFGATPTVRVIGFTSADYKLSDYGINTIVPCQPSLRRDQDPSKVAFAYNAQAYQSRSLSSAPEVSIEVQGTMRGIRVGSLVVNPVSYNAANNILRVFNDIEVEISFEGADFEETERMLVNTYSPYYDVVYKQMFNYREIQDVYSEHPDLWASPVHMIVVTPEDFQTALQPWKEWKIQKGFDVDVYTTAQTGSTYTDIKNYIQNLYTTGVQQGQTPTFVIIIGDNAQVPASAPSGSSTNKVTDLYYGSVDNDYFPDMFYSRMSADNASQLTAMVNKILMYEKYTMPDPSYLNNALLIAGWDPYWNSRVGQPTINYATTYYYNTAHGFSNVYAYLTNGQYGGCYNNLNTGVGFVNYTAHGDNTSWSDPSFTVANVNALTNTNKYFLAMGNCCLSGNWGYGTCLGESMIRAENKAAYSFIGSCPYSYWYEDYYFAVGATNTFYSTPSISQTTTGVYDGLFMDETYNTVSSMVFLGNISVSYAHLTDEYQTSASPLYYWQAYHVLGDGSIMPYNVQPTANTVNHASTFTAGASTFTVSAEPGSYVGISRDNVLLGAGLVGNSGSANIVVNPVTSGNVMIVVTRPQKQPYITTIPVGSGGNTPTVVFEQCTPDEIENGINESLTVTMKNVGNAATTGNTNVTISSSDSYLTIIDGTADFGAMTSNGGTATVANAFTVKAASNTPDNHVFNINVTATNGSSSWNSSFVLTSFMPCNAPSNLSATANANNINLSWTASSTATSYMVYRGTSVIASNVNGTTYTDSNLNYGTQYCYTVVSNCNGDQTSDPSNEACATTSYPCNAPTGLTSTVIDYTSIALSWNASQYATTYKVFRNNQQIAANITGTTYTDEDLASGQYCYRIKSVCSDGESDDSNQTCQTIELPCIAPQNLTAEYVYESEDHYGVSVEWDAPAAKDRDLNSFNLYRSTNGNLYDLAAQVESVAGQTHYTYFDALEMGLYFYQIRAYYDWNGETCESEPGMSLENPTSNCVMVRVTSIDENTMNTTIYPNPASDKLNIVSVENIRELKIYNTVGAMVYSAKACGEKAEISLQELPQGFYFVQITTNTSNETVRFVKE
jgi:Fibronectin type 3 domain-containing protein